jgi:hypothetical protein
MNPARSILTTEDEDVEAKAYIYAPNSLEATPLREFLESYGIHVYLNEVTHRHAAYNIVFGSVNFVKDIIAKTLTPADRTLILVFDLDTEDLRYLKNFKYKLVLVDSAKLQKQTVRKIFSFFFTGSETELDLRTEKSLTEAHKDIKPETSGRIPEIYHRPPPKQIPLSRAEPFVDKNTKSNQPENDRLRIQKTLEEVYGNPEKKSEISKSKKRQRKINPIYLVMFAIIFGVTPFIWYIISFSFSLFSIASSINYFEDGKIQISQKATLLSDYWLHSAIGTLRLIKIPAHLVFADALFRNQEQLLSLVSDGVEAMDAIHTLTGSGNAFIKTMTAQLYGSNGNTTSTAQLIAIFKTELPYIHDRLGLADAQLSYLINTNQFPFTINLIRKKAQSIYTKIDASRVRIEYFQNLLSLYSTVAGFDSGKKILLLLQNSMELRPTGGFIGSTGLAVMSDGLLSNLNVTDVYDLDGQLKGHIDPPKPLKELLNQEHWYLRDSNWDPDFRISGRNAAWFYQKESNTAVDGVIAISTPFVIDILKATGPISLTDYNDTITAENFYGKAFYYTQNGFFPGSTQKKDFLGMLTNAILLKVMHGEANLIILSKAVESALKSHAIMMYFIKPEIQQLAEQSRWAGVGAASLSCFGISKDTNCIGDFTQIVEANLSVNKVNYFVKRNQLSQIDFQLDGSYTNTISQEFTNDSEGKNGEGGGVYRNYERFYLPRDAILSKITLNGENIPVRSPVSKDVQILPYAEYDSFSMASESARIVGVAFDVKPKDKVNLILTYTRNQFISDKSQQVLYEYQQPIQPGIGDISRKTIIRTPMSWTIKPVDLPDKRDLLANTIQLEYNTNILADQNIQISIEKN